eukprot:GHVS01050415.1.p1 GENE.GHVS01050415.1~~GHVS01050415.1.p1  ORF type:complete len:164 (+),score=34.35 GHVS01050415.1:238-729(+)
MKLLVHFYQHLLLVLLGLMLFATEKAAAGITYGKSKLEDASTSSKSSSGAMLKTYKKLPSTEDLATGHASIDSTVINKPVDGKSESTKEPSSEAASPHEASVGCAIIDSTATEKAAAGIAHGKLTASTEDPASGYASSHSTDTEEGDGSGNGKSKKSHKGGAN